MNESSDEQTCQFFAGMKGDLVCDDPVVDGENVCEQHLTAYRRVVADD